MVTWTPVDPEIDVNEPISILKEIHAKMPIKAYDELPDVGWKRGGYTATAIPSKHQIVLRENSWKKQRLAGKRLILIHECVHLKGLEHSGIKFFSNGTVDLVSIALYEHIYGEDEPFQVLMAEVGLILISLVTGGKSNE